MIEYVKGALTDLTPALAVVEAAGVGYALNISLSTYTKIQGQKDVKLYVHEQLTAGGRDDSFTLYGFASKQERALYRLLISVSHRGQYGTHDALQSHPHRALQCHRQRRRQAHQRGQRHRTEDGTARHPRL